MTIVILLRRRFDSLLCACMSLRCTACNTAVCMYVASMHCMYLVGNTAACMYVASMHCMYIASIEPLYRFFNIMLSSLYNDCIMLSRLYTDRIMLSGLYNDRIMLSGLTIEATGTQVHRCIDASKRRTCIWKSKKNRNPVKNLAYFISVG